VGSYSFSPFKIAISGLYKKLNFNLILPYQNRPVIFDDTVYFLSFDDLDTAQKTLQLLNSSLGREFYSSLIFWDEKRPIKTRILNSLNLSVLAPTEANYKIKVRENINSFTAGKIKAIIPKLELVFDTQGTQNNKYVSVRANNKDITNGDLSNIQRNNNRCYIDEAKIKTYADKILFNLNTNLQEEKETVTYSIFGLPNSLLGPKDGLISFSIRLDQKV
jgi:hypothetical protein